METEISLESEKLVHLSPEEQKSLEAKIVHKLSLDVESFVRFINEKKLIPASFLEPEVVLTGSSDAGNYFRCKDGVTYACLPDFISHYIEIFQISQSQYIANKDTIENQIIEMAKHIVAHEIGHYIQTTMYGENHFKRIDRNKIESQAIQISAYIQLIRECISKNNIETENTKEREKYIEDISIYIS